MPLCSSSSAFVLHDDDSNVLPLFPVPAPLFHHRDYVSVRPRASDQRASSGSSSNARGASQPPESVSATSDALSRRSSGKDASTSRPNPAPRSLGRAGGIGIGAGGSLFVSAADGRTPYSRGTAAESGGTALVLRRAAVAACRSALLAQPRLFPCGRSLERPKRVSAGASAGAGVGAAAGGGGREWAVIRP